MICRLLHESVNACMVFEPKGDGFSFILIEPQRGDDGVAGFVWGLAHREKPANTSSQDAVVIRMKGFSRFLSNG